MYCEICKSKKYKKIYSDIQPLDEKRKKIINLKICKNCGFLFQNPKPSQKFLNKYYSKNINSSGKVFFENTSLHNNKFYQRYNFLKKNVDFKTLSTVLEVGSAKLEFLKILSKHRLNLTGIDPSSTNLRIRNIKIETTFMEKFKPKKKFDLICFFSVLEHVSSPDYFMKRISEMQNLGSKIYLEIPNTNYPLKTLAEYFNLEHISHFNFVTISSLLKNHNYTVFKKEIKKNYIRIIAKKSKIKKKENLKTVSNFSKMSLIVEKYKFSKKNIRIKIKKKIENFIKFNSKNHIAIYGAGIHTIYLKNLMKKNFNIIDYLIDGNIKKINSKFLNKKIVSLSTLSNKKFAIIISSQAFEKEISNKLKKKGFSSLKLYN